MRGVGVRVAGVGGLERSSSVVVPEEPVIPATSRSASGAIDNPYARFLRGEPVSNDDKDFEPSGLHGLRETSPATPSGLSDSDSEDEDEDRDGEDDEHRREQAQLYADLSTSASQAASAPLLLAHMTDTSPSPLTQRRYRRLMFGARRTDEYEEWDEFVLEWRRTKRAEVEARGEDALAEHTRNRVICTVELQDIICWPCR